MVWAVVTVVGFVLLTGLVTAMARSNTARWERDHRAPQAAARAHGAAMRRAWASTLSRWQHEEEEPAGPRSRLAQLHLPHVQLPAGLAERLPHPHVPHLHWPHLHVPHPRLPHLHLPHVHLPRRERAGAPPAQLPAPGADVSAGGSAVGTAEGGADGTGADDSAAGVPS